MKAVILIGLVVMGCNGPCYESGFLLDQGYRNKFDCHPDAKVEMDLVPSRENDISPAVYGKCVCPPPVGKK